MKILSQAANYGIRALVYIAVQNTEGYTSIGKISKDLDISFHFLTKTFQLLTKYGLIASYRGPGGGIMLKRPAENIFLKEVVEILEGDAFFETCLLGLPGCGEAKPCPLHDFWIDYKASLKRKFATTSLADLAEKVRQGEIRLSE